MALLPILTAPDPRLKKVAAPVAAVDDEVRALMDDMLETMYDAPGIGLAAVQVGVPKRVIVMDLAKDGEAPAPRYFVNPEILDKNDELRPYEEGCLSVPDIYDEVKRPSKVRLRYLDYDLIAANPKIIMGYSDITAILNAIYLRTGLVTFHGPIAGGNFSDYSYAQYLKVLVAPTASTRIGEPPAFETRPGVIDWENRVTTIVPGRAEGHLIGGNLALMVTLLGTPFEPDFAGAILFLEDVSEPPYSVDRMLTHLWMAGKLEQLAGIVLGKFTDDGYDSNTFSMEQVFRDRLQPLGIPTMRGAMIGHIEDKTVVPLGIRARLDADVGALTLLEPAVS